MTPLALTLRRGETTAIPIRLESASLAYAPIERIERRAPVRIHAPAHGLPDGWRAALANARGLTELNARKNPPEESAYRRINRLDANTLEINDINAAGFSEHIPGTGQLVYRPPLPLVQFAGARMQVKDAVGGNALAAFATACDGEALAGALEIDIPNNAIWLRLTAGESRALAFDAGVFDIELLRPDGGVLAICAADSTLAVLPEITTTECAAVSAIKTLSIAPGEDFRYWLQLQQTVFDWRPINAITNAAPLRLDVPAHGVPDGWFPVWIDFPGHDADLTGQATAIDPATLEFNAINGTDLPAYESGGYIRYRRPLANPESLTWQGAITRQDGAGAPIALEISVQSTLKTLTLAASRARLDSLGDGPLALELDAVDASGRLMHAFSALIDRRGAGAYIAEHPPGSAIVILNRPLGG
jgi:hypothetical protein